MKVKAIHITSVPEDPETPQQTRDRSILSGILYPDKHHVIPKRRISSKRILECPGMLAVLYTQLTKCIYDKQVPIESLCFIRLT
jgi:hypothetical protein